MAVARTRAKAIVGNTKARTRLSHQGKLVDNPDEMVATYPYSWPLLSSAFDTVYNPSPVIKLRRPNLPMNEPLLSSREMPTKMRVSWMMMTRSRLSISELKPGQD